MNQNVDLSSKLGDLLNVPPISIELLPGDASEWLASAPPEHAPFLFIDNNLGVPHRLAYKAYLEAVARFRAARPAHNASDCSRDHSAELLASSAVLLLVNPAHQTALNARKRLVLLGTHPASHELRFVDALLTVRDGAKQSILWHHRRWLLRHIHPSLPSPSPSSCAGDPRHGDGVDTLHGVALSPDAFRAEIAVAERACEAYPRNYHAWAHRFLCAEALVLLSSVSCPPPPPSPSPSAAASSESQGRAEALRELEAERARVRAWVERHVTDYSAMQYACRLEILFQSHLVEADSEERVGAGAGAHALELVRAYPSHEALWLYLRGALALDLFPSSSGTRERDADARAAIDGLTRKYLRVEESAIAMSGARSEAYAHAVRFVAWRKWMREGTQRHIDGTIVRRIAAAAEGDVTVTSEEGLLSYLSTGDARGGGEQTKSV